MAARIDTSLVTILVFMRRSKRANQPFEELILQLSEQPHLVLCGCIRSGDFWEWKKSLAWKYAAWNSCVFFLDVFQFFSGTFFFIRLEKCQIQNKCVTSVTPCGTCKSKMSKFARANECWRNLLPQRTRKVSIRLPGSHFRARDIWRKPVVYTPSGARFAGA